MNRARLLLLLLLLGSYGAGQNSAGGPAEVEQLQVKREGADVRIDVILTGAVQPSIETAINPDRLVLILPGTLTDAKQKRYPLNQNGVQGVRLGLNTANPPVSRVVVDLESARPYVLSQEGNHIILRVQPAEGSAAARNRGPIPAASAPLMGVFRRKPPAPPAETISAAAPIPVPEKLPPINFPAKPPASTLPATTAAAAPSTEASAAHPKLGSLQQGTVFPGMGTSASGTTATAPIPVAPAPADTQRPAIPVAPSSTAVVTQGNTSSTVASTAAPAQNGKTPAPFIVTAGTSAQGQSVGTVTATSPMSAAPAQNTAVATVGVSKPSATPNVQSTTSTTVSAAVSPAPAKPAENVAAAAPPATSSAGAANVTTKVVSATITTPPPATATSAAPATQIPVATVSNPLGTSATPAVATAAAAPTPAKAGADTSMAAAAHPAPASQTATVANPPGQPPAASTSTATAPSATTVSTLSTYKGATVDNPLAGIEPVETAEAVPADDSSAAVTATGGPDTIADETTVKDTLSASSASATAATSTVKSPAGTTTIAKAIEPEMPAALALRATHPDFRTSFRIKYVSSGTAYLDGGRAAGLAEGMKLVVRDKPTAASSAAASGSADHIVAELEVTSVAEASAVSDIHTPNRDVVPGDLAYLSSHDEQALVQQSTLSSTRKYPTVISFTESDTLDEEARAEIPKPPMPSINRARGRLGFDYMGTSFHGASGGSNTNIGLVARLDMTRIGGTYWNASGYWRGRLNNNSYGGQNTLQDLINRTYHLSMTYDNPHSSWVAGFGRMYLPWATSLDTIDGGYVGRRMSHGSTLGIFGGSTPDPTSWSYNPDRRMGGVFVNFEGGSYDNWRYTSTSGAGLTTLLWKVDRPFIFFENGIFYKRYVSIYDSLQADSPVGYQKSSSPGPGLGRHFLTVRFQPHERVEFDANYNYFRDIPTFDPALIGTSLLDKYLFQGFSGGVRLEVLKQVWLYTNLGRSNRSGDASSALNEMYGITFGRIPWVKLRADAHYSQFNSSFGSGYYDSISISRNLTDNFRLELLGGKQHFTTSLSSNDNTNFVTSNLEMNMGLHYFFQGGFTLSRGPVQNYDQWLFTLGYRFDTRTRAKAQ